MTRPVTITQRSEEVAYRKRVSLRRVRNRYTLIDLFSGAGGLTLGFSKRFGNPFKPIWANDIDVSASETYNRNFGSHCIAGDISKILESDSNLIPRADVVIGGPPCQGFSLLNKNRDKDPRKQLWLPFMQVVKLSRARVFVMENVPQILNSVEFDQICTLAKNLGFETVSGKLCAADFGAPQVRWRAFIIGTRIGNPASVFPPNKTHMSPKIIAKGNLFEPCNGYISKPKEWANVHDAIADLPRPVGTEINPELGHLDLHFGRAPRPISIQRYRAIPREGMNRFDLQKRALHLTPDCWIKKKSGGTDLFGRLWWDRPAFTIRTEFFKPEKGRYLHPKQHRPITHREAARLQTFPDDFKFVGSKIEIARQIGNAVPPILAARIADCVVALLEKTCSCDG